jgi:hypothetical protein
MKAAGMHVRIVFGLYVRAFRERIRQEIKMGFINHKNWLRSTALMCVALLAPGDLPVMAQAPSPPPAEAPKPIPPEQLDSLVAPIALYPDPLLAQVLAASTYPLEIVQLQQWLGKHKDLKDKALADAVQKEPWDPSVQGMAGLPDVVKQMADNISWTSELGDAFLAGQTAVMDAVQRMRGKAKSAGKLQSNEQMKVETQVIESKSVVVIEQANPKVVYVPSYDPVVVWGAPPPAYAYPPVYYPPPGYYAAGAAISFGVGVAMGAMWSGGWGYNSGWGGGNNNININNNNNFNRNTNNVGNGNRTNAGNGNRGNGNSWQHNPQHRGGAPYGDRSTANKFGGNARGDSASTRQANARQNAGRGQQSGAGNRAAAGNRGGANSVAANRGSGGGGLGGGAAGSSGLSGNRSGGSAGGDRIGNQRVSSGSGSRSSGGGAFSGSGGGGGAARSSSSRGASSASRGGGGGGRSGGGGRRR